MIELTGVLWPTDDEDTVEEDPSLLDAEDEATTSPMGTSQTSSRRKSTPVKPGVVVTLFLGNKPAPAQET